ncbi:MAG: CAP domain-containing protein [Chloroflexota bacterium]
MPKKKRRSYNSFPLLTFSLLLAIGGFIAIEFGFNQLLTSEQNSTSDFIVQVNPDMTQVPATNTAITPDDRVNSQTFSDILSMLNVARADAGLAPVQFDSTLNQAAAQQASYNALNRTVTHEDADGLLADTRVQALGYNYATVAENLLSNWTLDGESIYEQWRDSPPHQANMMKDDITEIGLAYHVTSYGQVYFAMVLAHPQS